MIKNITIVGLVATLFLALGYFTIKVNAVQTKYEKTCESSVKKSEKISQLVKELKELK